MISKEELLQLADLCKLEIAEDELEAYRQDLSDKIDFLDEIKEVDTEGVALSYNVNNMKNPLREDKVEESLPREEVLKNTVEEQYGYFKILKVMD